MQMCRWMYSSIASASNGHVALLVFLCYRVKYTKAFGWNGVMQHTAESPVILAIPTCKVKVNVYLYSASSWTLL